MQYKRVWVHGKSHKSRVKHEDKGPVYKMAALDSCVSKSHFYRLTPANWRARGVNHLSKTSTTVIRKWKDVRSI